MTKHYLYLITREEDKKQYVGVSVDPKVRLSSHKRGKGSVYLRERNDLTLVILACGSKEYIYDLEYEYIKKYSPELNIAPGGIGGFGDQIGIKNNQAKITNEQVLEIRNLAKANKKLTYTEIASKYDISREAVSNICRNTRWKHVGGPVILNRYAETQNLANKPLIRKLFDEEHTIADIVTLTGSCRATVYNTLRDSGINFTKLKRLKLEYLVAQCKKMHSQNIMNKDIEKALGISAPTVRKYIRMEFI